MPSIPYEDARGGENALAEIGKILVATDNGAQRIEFRALPLPVKP
jgi:hypothetical protein